MRVLRLVRHAILRVLPGVCKSRVRRYFWTWFIVSVVFLFVASLALVSVQFSSSKLPLHLEFDPVYELVMKHPSGNRWLDCTVDRRRELIRKHKRWPFSLTMPPYRIEYPNHCVKRSLYMFEFLRTFGVNPVTDNLETPHVFVLGAHTSLGRAVIRQLKMMNQSYMFVNSFDFLDFSNKELQRVLDYIEISKCVVCTTSRDFRHTKASVNTGDVDFFTSFIDWAQSRSIRIVFPSLPVASKAYDLMRKAGAVEVAVPYFVDKKVRNDPSNVLYHTISECRKAKASRIYVDGSQVITSLTAEAIATALLNETPLATYTESVQISKMAGYLAETMNCSVEFANHASVPEADGEVPSFVTYAAKARDKMRQLYLSIVVVGRHDGFAKGFEKRAQIFLDALANHTQKVPLASYEIVFVDYATPTEATKLSEVFVIHPVLRDKIRFVNVPATSHVRICHKLNTSISFLEYVAKNIGIRRAKGRYILTTNPDIFFSLDFFDQIEAEEFNEGVLYRAPRWNINSNADREYTPEEIVDAMNDPSSLASLGIRAACPIDIEGTTWELSLATIVNDAWPCGAGDFLLASHDMWFAVGGFDEYPGNAYVDAVFLGKLMKIVPGYIRHTLRTPIVHQNHPEQNSFRPSIRNYEELIKMYGCDAQCNALDDTNWGLSDEQFQEEAFV